MSMEPKIFRLVVEVLNLAEASRFYDRLLGIMGRPIRGSRIYYDCGGVLLAVLDPTPGDTQPRPNSGDIYFAVNDLEVFYERAKELGCLASESVHGASAGEITVRPWGERSFYAIDPWKNGLCFVDESTVYTGH
jgi:hypothetical protein